MLNHHSKKCTEVRWYLVFLWQATANILLRDQLLFRGKLLRDKFNCYCAIMVFRAVVPIAQ